MTLNDHDHDRDHDGGSDGRGRGGRVRIPADVDRPDTLLGGLTARQLAILAAAAVALWAGYLLTAHLLPLPVFGILAVPVAGVAVTIALGQRDGIGADKLLLAAMRHRRAPQRMVLAPDGTHPAPPWAGAVAGLGGPGAGGRVGAAVPAALLLPLAGIRPDGLIDLGADGQALICRASAVTFSLRTHAEQSALVAAFARWLNSLDTPVQILIRATPLDLTPTIRALRRAAPGMPDPGLEAAALDYAQFLSGLAAGTDLLTQQVLLILRQPPTSIGGQPAPAGGLARRAEQAASALAAAGVSITVLDGAAATACLNGCFDPTTPTALENQGGPLATPTEVITAAPVAAGAAGDFGGGVMSW